ncbi:MAG: DUF1559 domain-containing protein, partial [Sedimentisphaerales bacterium]|nr:DUF1559 domain-containing protein [Sedimentisphaerales bacterium]
PVMGLAKQYARSMRCGSNLHQLSLKLINYDVKNESFPYSFFDSNLKTEPPGGRIGNAVYDDVGWRWPNYIFDSSEGRLNENPLYWCPSRRMEGRIFKNNMLVANYGVNESICKSWSTNRDGEFAGSSLSSADIRFPQQTLLIVDSGYTKINWYHVTDSPPRTLGKSMEDRAYLPGLAMNKKRNLLPEQEDDAKNGRHMNKTVNIGFVDGHIDSEKADNLFIEKTADGYKNLSPLWVPRKK